MEDTHMKCSDCAVWPKLKSQGVLDNGYGHMFDHRMCPKAHPWADQQRHEQRRGCKNFGPPHDRRDQ